LFLFVCLSEREYKSKRECDEEIIKERVKF
jgi:hypothetical protein